MISKGDRENSILNSLFICKVVPGDFLSFFLPVEDRGCLKIKSIQSVKVFFRKIECLRQFLFFYNREKESTQFIS